MKFSQKIALAAVLCLTVTCNSFAHNKVVVVPLGDDAPKRAATVQRTLMYNAHALSGGAPIVPAGRRFSNTFVASESAASLIIKQPRDWDGVSDVTVELFTRGTTTGSDSFFVRPRDYNDGDTFLDAASVRGNTRLYTQLNQYRVITVTLSAASLSKDWWYFVIQRDTINGSNTGDITLNSVAVSYVAINE